MIRIPRLQKSAKIAVAAALLAATGSLALTAPASADADDWHGGWHGGWHHEWREGHRGWWAPRVFAAPVYVPPPGPHCWIQRRWVAGPWGWHWAPRRVCSW